MKKLVSVMAWCLLALLLLLPAGWLLCSVLRYRLTLTKAWVYALALAALSVGTMIGAIIDEAHVNRTAKAEGSDASAENAPGPTGARVFYALLPAAVLNGVFLLLQRNGPILILLMLVTVFCSAITSFQARSSRRLRSLSLSLTGIIAVPLAVLGLLSLLFGGVAEDTVVRRVPSPNGSFYAEIIDNDQGAMGGSTLVELCPRGMSGEYGVRVARQIYAGRWGEFFDMELSWKDESCLEINGNEAPIP